MLLQSGTLDEFGWPTWRSSSSPNPTAACRALNKFEERLLNAASITDARRLSLAEHFLDTDEGSACRCTDSRESGLHPWSHGVGVVNLLLTIAKNYCY